jgi:hypothetical protein
MKGCLFLSETMRNPYAGMYRYTFSAGQSPAPLCRYFLWFWHHYNEWMKSLSIIYDYNYLQKGFFLVGFTRAILETFGIIMSF